MRVPENYFDARIARTYEVKWPELFDPAEIEPVVSFLAALAGSGAALELGIGTGRLALRMAVRAGPDGPACRDDLAQALG